MARRPRVIRTLAALRRATARLRAAGETLALVPTMGALHKGHLSLVQLARRRTKHVIVSIFVNPTQFAPNEDLAAYPRTFEADLDALAPLAVEIVWAPGVEVMYPQGFATRIVPEGPACAGLEDAFRPHFFGGVATVVAKLFTQCHPDLAVFGEKDYQQLLVIRRMARDLDLPVKILAAPVVRETDGLALSSRNVYLSPPERAAAPAMFRALRGAADAIGAGTPIEGALANGRRALTQAGFEVDYFEARNAETLAPVASPAAEPIRLLVAARLGKTRLIDNVAV
jgi:pantoate--beta-alanine ligase